jgi:hypothetical protein
MKDLDLTPDDAKRLDCIRYIYAGMTGVKDGTYASDVIFLLRLLTESVQLKEDMWEIAERAFQKYATDNTILEKELAAARAEIANLLNDWVTNLSPDIVPRRPIGE